jgi:hypothetical protein
MFPENHGKSLTIETKTSEKIAEPINDTDAMISAGFRA